MNFHAESVPYGVVKVSVKISIFSTYMTSILYMGVANRILPLPPFFSPSSLPLPIINKHLFFYMLSYCMALGYRVQGYNNVEDRIWQMH